MVPPPHHLFLRWEPEAPLPRAGLLSLFTRPHEGEVGDFCIGCQGGRRPGEGLSKQREPANPARPQKPRTGGWSRKLRER